MKSQIPGPIVFLLGLAGTFLPILLGVLSVPSRAFAAALWLAFLSSMIWRVSR